MSGIEKTAGVVLAGGRSSRMGRDKAHLIYNGLPLVEHMKQILASCALDTVYVSGRIGETCARFDCPCLPDKSPFAGPAIAIQNIMGRLHDYDGILFVPVDMPLLTPHILNQLIQAGKNAHYESGPLPLFLRTNQTPNNSGSIHGMLSSMDVTVFDIPDTDAHCFSNINTPQDWERLAIQ